MGKERIAGRLTGSIKPESGHPDRIPGNLGEQKTHIALINEHREELRLMNEELKEHTRLLELQQDEIRQKNLELKLARHEIREKASFLEIASRYKSEFFAHISHEFRTPLNSIIVLSQLIAENKANNLTEKQVEYARTIYHSGNILLELINEILEVTRIESGKIVLHPSRFSLKELSSQLQQLFFPVAQQKGLELIIDLQPGLPETLYTDVHRLNQILRNLVSNAIKFTEKGEVKVRFSRPEQNFDLSNLDLSPDQVILISVSDTGIGIPNDKKDLIFEAFQQADGTTSHKYGGTGLGLTIARSLATMLGGEIKIQSRVGEGSAFYLTIPDCYAECQVQKAKSRTPSPWKTNALENNVAINQAPPLVSSNADDHFQDDRDTIIKADKTLLIVDDDREFANILYDIARDHGFKCLIANNGELALHYTYLYNPASIILDICLPDINGWEVMENLKSNPATCDIPVFFISGAEESNEVTEMGAIGFLTKPVNMEMLRGAFQKIGDSIAKSREGKIETPGNREIVNNETIFVKQGK